MNLPNKLTLLRICLIPVFVILMLSQVSNFFLISCIIFIIASITDFLDGKIARKYNLVTDFGKFMDPLADKLLVLSALICMIEYDLVAGWMVIIIVARELTVSILRAIAADNGKVIAASSGGKLKTISQMVAIVILLLGAHTGKIKTTSQMIAIILLLIGANYSNSQIVFVGTIAMYIATIFTLYSGIDYLYKNRELFMNSK